jgi:hypothetical protein
MKLEKLAKSLYLNNSASLGNTEANWSFLTASKKVAWMKEALIISDFYTKELLLTIKPPVEINTLKSSYSLGYEVASKGVYKQIVESIKQTHQELEQELEDYLFILNQQRK